MQAGVVEKTWADVQPLMENFGYKPKTDVKTGVNAFIDWYRDFCKI